MVSNSLLQGAFARVETERLLLRLPTWDDIDDVFRIHGDPATWRHDAQSRHVERGQSEEFLRRWRAEWEERGYGYWSVERDGRVIGFGGLMLMPHWRDGRDVLNVYYRFEPSAWGHGYASEMVAAAVALADERLPGVPLVARVRPANTPSARVAIRAGFERRPELDGEGLQVYALGW